MPPIAATIATIVAAAASTGLGIYEATQQPSAPSLPKAVVNPPLTPAQNSAQQAAVSQALPNLQSLTGGSLSPEYAASYGATTTGLGNDPRATGNIQEAINQFFGLNAPGTSGFTPESTGGGGGNNILDLLRRSIPSTNGAFPSSDFSGGDSFKGLAG